MIFTINAIGLVIVFVYFFTQQRRGKEIWQSFRKRKMERGRNPTSDPLNPIFQFDLPEADVKKDRPSEPN
jgi:hypothetical protein